MSGKPIGHLNVRSLFTSFNEFTNIILRNDLDIVAVSETWLSYDICSDIVKITDISYTGVIDLDVAVVLAFSN
jgi:hypothetical protein